MMRLLQSRWKKSSGCLITIYVLILILFHAPLPVHAGGPMKELDENIFKAIGILNNPSYREGGNREKQFQELWVLLLQSFDFHEFSKRALSSHWKKFSAQEQKDFVAVFSKFIGGFYLRRVQDSYTKERVFYKNQERVSDSRAVIHLEVLRNELRVPVKVKMTNKSGSWKVYDLVFLGISGVSNYRAQFSVLLKKQSPAQVIAGIREKMERQRVKKG